MTIFRDSTESEAAHPTVELVPRQPGPPADQDALLRPNPPFPGDAPDE